jgi:predicted CxxxxCH...CXXCH cytochrome family protein
MTLDLPRLSLVLVAATLVAACGGNAPTPASVTTGEMKGKYGAFYYVNVSRPVGGTINSGDGKIDCGTVVGVHDLCGPALYNWTEKAYLTATPDTTALYFQSWAGDCSGAIPDGCILDTNNFGADKWVAAVFNPADRLGHTSIPDPGQHGPLFFNFIKSLDTKIPGTPRCNTCHGVNYDGLANAPSCTACHAQSGHGNWLTDCSFCHGNPPASHAPASTNCSSCHASTVNPAGTIIAGGKHMNGAVCDSCHGFPPATGAHLAHFGLTPAEGTSSYGDLSTLETRFPTATPTTAPAKYAFGCGNCHPIDIAQHTGKTAGAGPAPAKVVLYEVASASSSLKARNPSTATFNANKSCSNVYCHSSGQESPTFVATPAWDSGTHLACNDCHENPPRYVSDGGGTAAANSHLQLDNKGAPWGHYSFVMTDLRYTQHGRGNAPNFLGGALVYSDAAPITCQTCHFATTDPSNTGPSGFYWLDTTGDYSLPNSWNYAYRCASCHTSGSATAPLGTGRVLPLRHVNGSADVAFDARTGNPNASWVPSPNVPQRPYWFTQGSTTLAGWNSTNRTMSGTTLQFDLGPARYDPVNKTCTNVTCHIEQGNTSYTGSTPQTRFEPLQWGSLYYASGGPVDPAIGRNTCQTCHRRI